MAKEIIDKQNMLGFLKNFPEQIIKAEKIVKKFGIADPINRIVVAGMGGSALAGKLMKDYFNDMNYLKYPIDVVTDYNLPKNVDRNTLFIASSYSGSTEETISCFREAVRKGCKIVGMTTGGKLKELCERHNLPCLIIPEEKGMQPRTSIGYQFFILLHILQNSKIIPNQEKYIKDTYKSLKKDSIRTIGKDLAKNLLGQIPLIYASERFKHVAYKWKIDFNENAKTHAFYNVFPELNHNEMNGYVNKIGDFHVIILHDDKEHPRIEKRMKIMKKLIMKKGYETTELMIKAPCMLAKMFSAIAIGDWTSYFLALEYGINPTPVDIIEDFKELMKE